MSKYPTNRRKIPYNGMSLSVGTGFENSALKASFSLSSLQPSETPEKGVKIRAFNSLTKKKRRDVDTWRRSWGSTGGSTASDQKDDFWAALQANYDYIMDNQLIDNCREAYGEINSDTRTWSLKEFYKHFSDLYSALNSVQEMLRGKNTEDINVVPRSVYFDEIVKIGGRLKLFNEQASHLVQLHSDMEEEVKWRTVQLHTKWEAVETELGLINCKQCSLHTCKELEHEVRRLRTWMKSMENRLQPLNFHIKWSKTELETKIMEHKVLHQNIESHGKIVNSLLRLCKGVVADDETHVSVQRAAVSLERRWQLLFLRSLEWQCYLDEILKDLSNNWTSVGSSDSDYDDEPVNKWPRLHENITSSKLSLSDDRAFIQKQSANNMQTSKENNSTSMETTDLETQSNQKSSSTFTECVTSNIGTHRKAPNFGTFYFKHEDTTDSEMPIDSKTSSVPSVNVESTSEDEWTYSSATKSKSEKTAVVDAKLPCESIRKLVLEAEELVCGSPLNGTGPGLSLNKMSRVKQWLNIEKSEDSCDASCEDEIEKLSESTSEDFNESIATCKAQRDHDSTVMVEDVEKTPKVALRKKGRNARQNRPWSVSCISQLSSFSGKAQLPENFSISESALHQLSLNAKYSKSTTTSTNSMHLCHNSTSSTMEDGGVTVLEQTATPIRRKRLRLRKKSSYRNRNGNNSICVPECKNVDGPLVKSRSFSGCSTKSNHDGQMVNNDPSNLICESKSPTIESKTSSLVDSDEERQRNKKVPAFKIGDKTSYLTIDERETSPGKISLTTMEEQLSSLSEQAWDSYQEKYLSEAYSEAQDSDAARRLLEFGEDYRNFLDSQSDWSTQSTNPERSPAFARKLLLPMDGLESESDNDDMRYLLKESRDELLQMTKIYTQRFNVKGDNIAACNMSDVIATSDRHIYCLSLIDKSPEEYSLLKVDKNSAAELLAEWLKLKEAANRMQDYANLKKEIKSLRNQLISFKLSIPFDSISVSSFEEVQKNIDFYSTELSVMEERKSKLLTLNVAVHRFVIENKNYDPSLLKTDIAELYRIWYDTYSCVTERVHQLKSFVQTWQALEGRLDQLQGDLQEDKETLVTLDSALRDGNLSTSMATSVREVAKVLSETHQGTGFPGLLSESSLSDSGISDEGSEHEQGERERRLASIRHLIRQLEAAMAPDCSVRTKLNERLLETEDELRNLQKRCRSLVVRTAVSAVTHTSEKTTMIAGDSGDPEGKPDGGSWFKRVFKVSFRFQIALMALFLLACLMEPHCCDNMNTFSMSLTPQLRYTKGPPPI